MSFLGSLWKGITGGQGLIGSIVGGITSSIQNRKNREWNAQQAELNREFQSVEAEKSRVFNSNEAALQRDWSAAEAERARDWNEEMYEKYNSLSGKIAQAEQAGVNPMLAITGNAVSPMAASSSSPSGASASSGSPSGSAAASSFIDIVGSMLGMAKLKAEIDNIKADTKKKDTEENRLSTLTQAELENILMNTSKIESDIHVNEVTAGKLSAEALKLQQEGIRLSKITDAEVKKTEAEALLAEFETSVYRITSDFENADTSDFIQAGIYLLQKIIGIGVQLSPKGIVQM